MQIAMQIVNISAYKFITLDDTVELRPRMHAQCEQRALKGTILLAPEGINMFLAGPREAIDGFMAWLKQDARFADIEPKESPSDSQPFKRMLVRLKKEIITMRMPLIRPEEGRAPSVAPVTLKRWLDQGHDDTGREVLLLDTRKHAITASPSSRNFPNRWRRTATNLKARRWCRSAPAGSAARKRRSICRKPASSTCTSSRAVF